VPPCHLLARLLVGLVSRVHYKFDSLGAVQARDPLPAFQQFCKLHKLLTDDDFKEIDAEVKAMVEESVEFADASPKPDKGQLLENVFADPKGFGIGPDGKYRYTQPGFTSGSVQVS
jgi:pyruvate dehydrogenase E1 component alpha subunit